MIPTPKDGSIIPGAVDAPAIASRVSGRQDFGVPVISPKEPENNPLSAIRRVGNVTICPVRKTSLVTKENAENGTQTAVKKII